MKKIIITQPQKISQKDKGLLIKNGCLVIEVDDPTKVRVLSAETEHMNISANNLTMAALEAIASSSWADTHTAFVRNLKNRLLAEEAKQKSKSI